MCMPRECNQVGNNLLGVVTAVLASDGGQDDRASRHIEIAAGIVGNLACHTALAPALGDADGPLAGICACLLSTNDVPCLTEACRALAIALQTPVKGQWRTALVAEEAIARLLDIAANSLDSTLLERILDVIGALAGVSEAAMQWLLAGGMVPTLAGLLHAYCRVYVSHVEQSQEGAHATEEVADGVLRVLEFVAAHEDGGHLVEAEGGSQLLRDVLDALCLSDSEAVESSAVCVLSEWQTDMVLRALLQDVAALKAVLAKLDKGSDEAQASAWALLSALCHHMKAGASAGGLWGSVFCVITAALTEFLDVVVPDGQRCALVTVVEDLLQCQPADGGIDCRDPAAESLTDGILVLRTLRASLDPCV
eukprot:jgi/Tetstr1/429720/TSEL_019613.t3